ncbi:hypothetical protein LJY25_03005 [Hymenobacter sp. BT175]|uniref:hypothetical protein n=1 Tax=Hymenobacter translucens TaxID=2886507 RepID=UPI001D0E9C02|nr:hypothetical protein [Hymenobacter translucens]MCC2545400.1 hypothetical protein [Hymenobacter translucens]
MMSYWPLLIPTGIGFFIGFWCLIVKGISQVAWSRLVARFGVVSTPAGSQITLPRARLGVVSYQNAIRAGIAPDGLSLSVNSLFRVGHPPLLIPWSALEPFQTEQSLWTTFYSTTIRLSGAAGISLTFNSDDFIRAARPWIRLQGEANQGQGSEADQAAR